MTYYRRRTDRDAVLPAPDLDVTLVCWVGTQHADLAGLHAAYRDVLARTGRTAEFLYVLDGPRPRAQDDLSRVGDDRFPVRILRMAKGFGEAAGLQYGFELARGRHVLTAPDRFQAEPSVIPELLARLDAGADIAVARRERAGDAMVSRLQYRLYHTLIRRLSRRQFHDISSGLRALTIHAARRLDLYGDLHRFIPVLAARLGFEVVEVPAAQHPDDRGAHIMRPGIYARRLLDLLNVLFLTRFTRKPLRFFGLIGMVVAFLGVVVCAWLAAERLAFKVPLTDRPLLLLGVLLTVIGVQLASLGLLGEIVLFLSLRRESPEVSEIEPALAPSTSTTSENPSRPR